MIFLNKNRIILYILITVYSFSILLRDIYTIRIGTFFFLFIALIASLILNKEYLPAFIAFIIAPNMNMSYSSFTIIFLIFYILKNLNKIHLGKWAIPVTILLTIELLSYYHGYFEIIEYIKFMSVMVLVMLIIHNNKYYSKHVDVLISFVIGVIISFLSIMLQTLKENSLIELFITGNRIGVTDTLENTVGNNISLNPNSLGMLATMSLSLLLVYWYDRQKVERVENKQVLFLAFMFLLFMGSTSMSRAFFLEIILILLIYIYSNRNSISKFLRTILIVFFLLATILITAYMFIPELLLGILERFKAEDITSGRDRIFNMYHESFLNNPKWWMFGTGLQDSMEKAGLRYAIHNSIQQVYFTWGVIGLGVVVKYFEDIFNSVLRTIDKNQQDIVYLIPLIILLIATLSSRFFSSFYTVLLLIPAHSALCLQIDNKGMTEVC